MTDPDITLTVWPRTWSNWGHLILRFQHCIHICKEVVVHMPRPENTHCKGGFTALLHTSSNVFSCLVETNPV